jgi:hypothetical protein
MRVNLLYVRGVTLCAESGRGGSRMRQTEKGEICTGLDEEVHCKRKSYTGKGVSSVN